MDAESPLAKALELGAALEAQSVPYAIGGALAYGMWGFARRGLDHESLLRDNSIDAARLENMLEMLTFEESTCQPLTLRTLADPSLTSSARSPRRRSGLRCAGPRSWRGW